MATWTPDPTFYPSPRMAARAPAEKLAYVAEFDPERKKRDRLAVVDVDPRSSSYASIVGRTEVAAGDELHHFGWNACSSCLCPNAPHPHVERRYLIVPGLRSSNIHILDTKPDPKNPKLVRTITAEELAERAGYSRPHTVHCGPEGIYVSALGNAEGKAPGGIFLIDHTTFDVLGRWEMDRGPQELAYDFWWHLGHDTLVTSEWGTPDTVENGLIPEMILGAKYGRRLHFWDLHKRKNVQTIDFGDKYQLVFELRPAHDPTKAYGFVNCVLSLEDLSSSIWTWYRDGDKWAVKKVITIPAEPAEAEQLPPLLQGFKAVPPLVTDIDLSVDDKYLYVSCWGTGDFQQYDVSDPMNPKLTGKLRLGGIVSRAPHPKGNGPLNGGPQMVEVSRDGKRIYFTNSLYGAIDPQFYPDGIKGWMVKVDAKDGGGMALDEGFFLTMARGPPAAPGAPAGRRRVVGLVLLPVRRPGACLTPDLARRARPAARLTCPGSGCACGRRSPSCASRSGTSGSRRPTPGRTRFRPGSAAGPSVSARTGRLPRPCRWRSRGRSPRRKPADSRVPPAPPGPRCTPRGPRAVIAIRATGSLPRGIEARRILPIAGRHQIVERDVERAGEFSESIDRAGLAAGLDLDQVAGRHACCHGQRPCAKAAMLAPDADRMLPRAQTAHHLRRQIFALA